MSDGRRGDAPEYKVYRSRRGLLDSLRPQGGLERLRKPRRPRLPGRGERGPGKGLSWQRVLKWVALVVLGWLLLSFVLFMVSAQVQEGVSERAEDALSAEGNFVTGSTVLVIGSDLRSDETREPGFSGPGRADSILLLRAGFGSVRKLSILRDSFAEIPGHGAQKINAAYAIGGAGLMVETVERFMGNGLEINHVVEVDFTAFPELIDALGGITVVAKRRICAPPFGNFKRTLRFKKGENEVNGRRALGFARVRKNPCSPGEDDRARAQRQQEVLNGIRRRLVSPGTFLRLPWVSWEAPKTVKSDMKGPGLISLFGDLATGGGGGGENPFLEPTCLGCGPGTSAIVSPEARQAAVEKLLGE
jgi:LCP family protein required for cell wall assembly